MAMVKPASPEKKAPVSKIASKTASKQEEVKTEPKRNITADISAQYKKRKITESETKPTTDDQKEDLDDFGEDFFQLTESKKDVDKVVEDEDTNDRSNSAVKGG